MVADERWQEEPRVTGWRGVRWGLVGFWLVVAPCLLPAYPIGSAPYNSDPDFDMSFMVVFMVFLNTPVCALPGHPTRLSIDITGLHLQGGCFP
eukprot:366192-Chlamydomonas_euryale.AAC.7